ncbi:MAG: TrkH family potassium uptake protein [Prevotella sp.]|nr:TrkH family potassium uptake protein [Prevotella sp.]MBQ7716001.1 TrkH family potassium uptake protein [Prevotella sp.]MBQ9571217.1 TrkH family potassium uptake protein [Prevotella sp.]MBR0524830.1 TrkH family potassium uptake protein [Prevotella sp.]
MLNIKLIYKIIGSLLFLEAVFLLICLGISLFYMEDDMLAFLLSFIIIIIGGILFRYAGRNATNTLGRRDAYLLVTLTWIIFSLFGCLPFLASGYVSSPTDAFFETMSGFTTTGASVIDDVEHLPHALLFWRSLTQWIGGLGIVFFTIAIIPSLVGGNMKVFSAEATGPIRAKMHPRLTTTAKWIWSIYLLLTVGCAAAFYIFGMSIFDCLNYAMTVTATGGFSTHNDPTGYYHSAGIDYSSIVFMFLAGISFTLLYTSIFKGRIKQLFKNSEFKLYCALVIICTLLIVIFLCIYNNYTVDDAIRYGLYQVVSFLTTTGVFNVDAAQWPHFTWVVLCVCMFFGGCAGSTAGGFKCVRGVMILKIVRNEFKRILHPKAILPVKVNDTNINYSAQVTLMAYFAAYMFLALISYLVMVLTGIDNTNAITVALSCASNIGPTLSLEIGPSMSWTTLPIAVKWILSALMLMGRLEIFSVAILFTPEFWKDN